MNKRVDSFGAKVRLKQARRALMRQERFVTLHFIGGTLLTCGQLLIGGLLTSSFVQETFSKTTVGLFGMLVLASSILRQYYRPENRCMAGRVRVARLQALIRDAEDMISEAENDAAEALPFQRIRKFLTEGLSKIEMSEMNDLVLSAQDSEVLQSGKLAKQSAD